jgi:hypothetical protein
VPDTPASAEVCDGLDNDCDGSTDEGTSGAACGTGQQGVCAQGTEQCVAGSTQCVPDTSASAEVCDGLDNDCDGSTDEGNAGGGGQCGVSAVGECQLGTESCVAGALVCVGNIDPVAEVCDGLDNDCDGTADDGNPGGGASCSGGGLGVCGDGTEQCQGGAIVCVSNNSASPEVCDGLDNDCDGSLDEGNPDGGGSCDTGELGACAAGTELCQSGGLICVRNNGPTADVCNGIDDDCNGVVDDVPGSGEVCATGLPGACASGTQQCSGGSLACEPTITATHETCNGLDDNCDGQIDEGNPEGGGSCDTGELGACAAGTDQCVAGAIACVADSQATAEVCGSGADEDCDGAVDEPEDCVLCLAENTISLSNMTKRNKVKLSSTPNRDKIIASGTFFQPSAGFSQADEEEVLIRMTDAAGLFYQGTLPVGSIIEGKPDRKYDYKDKTKPFELDGLRQFKLRAKKNLIETKYKVKAQEINLPAFFGTASMFTIKIGDTCYVDSLDTCTPSSSGTSVKCQ